MAGHYPFTVADVSLSGFDSHLVCHIMEVRVLETKYGKIF